MLQRNFQSAVNLTLIMREARSLVTGLNNSERHKYSGKRNIVFVVMRRCNIVLQRIQDDDERWGEFSSAAV